MARFFFNIRLDDAYLPERTGQCVEGPEAARAVARTIIRALVAQHGGEPRLLNAAIVVTDEAGDPVFELSFFEAIYVPVALPARASPVRTVGGPEPRGRPTLATEARTRLGALRTHLSGVPVGVARLRLRLQARWAEGVERLRGGFGRPPGRPPFAFGPGG
jgi:hypothetical protein